MGTDEDLHGPTLQVFQQLHPVPGPGPSRKQGNAHGQALKEAAEFLVMLGCQDFCRRHEGSLIAVFHDFGQGQGRNDGLAGTDVPLDEALHGHFAFHVVLDIEEGTGLASGQGKGQLVKKLLQ